MTTYLKFIICFLIFSFSVVYCGKRSDNIATENVYEVQK